MTQRPFVRVLAAGALSAIAAGAAAAPEPYRDTIPVNEEPDPAPLTVGGIEVTFMGFVKLDVMYSSFSDGDVSSLDAGRDYFRPASIPVAASSGAEDSHSFVDFHVKDTRFGFKTKSQVADHELVGTLEMDFRSAPGAASEVVTNGFNPRIYRGFFTWDRWAIGQEWTLMRNLDASPDHIDDIRATVPGLAVARQPLVRYTWGDFQFGLESAESNLLPFGGGTTFVTGDSIVPDVTARYNLKSDFGSFSSTVIARELRADNAATGGAAPNNVAHGTAYGYGLNVSGKVPLPALGGDDVRFAITGGEGISRYVAIATVADAAVDANYDLETIFVVGGYVSYRRVWHPQWRSTFSLAALTVDNETSATGAGVTSAVQSVHANIIFAPVDKFTIGLELTHAIREIESGQDGTMQRLQFGAKYEF